MKPHIGSEVNLIIVNGGRLVMKAGGLQRTNSLFWFMACHVIAKVHRIIKIASSEWRCFEFVRVYSFFTYDLETI